MTKYELKQLLIKGDKSFNNHQELWFKRYNDVVDVYNMSEDRKARLDQLYCPYKPYLLVSRLLNNYLFNIAMILTLAFLPLFNIVLQLFLISYMFFLKKQTNKHLKNVETVSDPFQDFFYYPEMCNQLKKHFTTLNLTV